MAEGTLSAPGVLASQGGPGIGGEVRGENLEKTMYFGRAPDGAFLLGSPGSGPPGGIQVGGVSAARSHSALPPEQPLASLQESDRSMFFTPKVTLSNLCVYASPDALYP